MSDTSYNIEQRLASKNGYFTPEEANAHYRLKYARNTYVTHWFGQPGQVGNHDQTVSYILGQANAGNMSVNYVVSDSKITMVVPPDMVSWGAGPTANPIGINVEHDPNLGAEGYKKAGWLLDQLEKRWNKGLSVTRHSDYMPTQCCGHIDTNRIRAEADKWKRGEYDRPPAPLWTVQDIPDKQVQVKPNSRKWNLGHGNFNDVANNPITTAPSGEVFIARAILRHREIPQYNYYLEDPNTPHGWNVLDCVDYTPPPPPYVPPAGSVRPVLVEYYDLKTTVTWFKAAADARKDENAKGTLDPGKYILLASDGMARKLTKNNHDVETFWINDGDNKLPELPPVPEPVITQPVDIVVPVIEPVDPPAPALPKHQFQMINPIQLEAINAESQTFPDLEGKTKILVQLNPGKVNEYTMRTIIDGEEWLVPTVSMKRGYRHAVPRDLLDYPQTEAKYNLFDRDKDGDVDTRDFSDGLQGFLDIVPKWYKTTVAPLAPKLTEVKTRAIKTMDGFVRRSTKK